MLTTNDLAGDTNYFWKEVIDSDCHHLLETWACGERHLFHRGACSKRHLLKTGACGERQFLQSGACGD